MKLNIKFEESNETFSGVQESNEQIDVGFGSYQTVTENDYTRLANKPSLNGITIEGDQTSDYYQLPRFWFGTLAEYNALPVIYPDICYCIEEGA